MYVRVWQYDVDPDDVDRFVAAYAGEGDWAVLFLRGAGYAGTELYRDVDDPTRFLTVDRWASEADWLAFRRERAAEYEALGARLEPLSLRQQELLG